MIKLCSSNEPLKLGIPYINNVSLFFTYSNEVYFSASARGDTLEAHIAATKEGKKIIRSAVNEFCEYIFKEYPQYKKIAANVKLKSVRNLCLKCGFEKLADIQDCEVFVRWAK